jgi:hypothetical protein
MHLVQRAIFTRFQDVQGESTERFSLGIHNCIVHVTAASYILLQLLRHQRISLTTTDIQCGSVAIAPHLYLLKRVRQGVIGTSVVVIGESDRKVVGGVVEGQ